MSTLLISAGLLLIALGFLLVMFGSIGSMFGNSGGNEDSKTEVKGGGIIMIGPIPIIFGSDNKSAQTLVILAIVLMVLYFIVFR
ncbi:MAG: TIGR00304 family protein [Methanolobus sp.]|nr:TIGR00304 family protein [Methanolobus sp.]